MNTPTIIGLVSLAVTIGGLIIGWLQYRRMPEPPEPAYKPSVVVFDVVTMKEPPGLPGHSKRKYR